MNICVVKVTNQDDATHPLASLCGPWYWTIKEWCNKYNHSISYWGIRHLLNQRRSDYNNNNIKNADLIFLVTDRHYRVINETFQPAALNNINRKVEILKELFEGKTVIVLSNEVADTPELFKQHVFTSENINLKYVLESDFDYTIQTLRYHFFKNYHKESFFLYDRSYKFGYWGSSKSLNNDGTKSDDKRAEIVRDIRKKLKKDSLIMGGIVSKPDRKYRNDNRLIYNDFATIKTTLCFVWPGREKYLTSRFQESIATGIFPLVWENFDSTNSVVKDKWLRCFSSEEALDKIDYLNEKEKFRNDMVNFLMEEFEKNTPPMNHYVDAFEERIKKLLK